MTATRTARRLWLPAIALVVGSLGSAAAFQAGQAGRWVTGWGTSQNGLGATRMSNATVRLVARITIPGDAVRIRLDNTFGTEAVEIGAAYVGHRVQREILAKGSNRPVLFDGATTVRIPVGGTVTSDPVTMKVATQDDLAVSLYVAGADVQPSQHGGAFATSYLTANGTGNVAADEVPPVPGSTRPAASPFTETTTSTFWLKAIDVLSSTSTGAIVTIGDSITDGSCSTVDGWDRWVDVLAVRLALAGIPKAVINEGIGGNTITRPNLQPPPNSETALERFDRDVLSHHGVTHVILFEGTNDIRREAPTGQVTSGMAEIIKRVRARGLTVIGATIVPRHDYPAVGTNTGWDAANNKVRHEVNQWMRTKAPFDAVLDFDKTIRDPQNPEFNYPSFHCDGIHPSPRGYFELAKSVPLELFEK